MKLSFRQGIVDYSTAGGVQTFLSASGSNVNLLTDNGPVDVTFAFQTVDYLFSENATVTSAWTNLPTGDVWIYWDLDLRTAVRTFGYTTLKPVSGVTAPNSPQTDQHWFDLTTYTMKVYTSGNWVKKLRVFAAKVTNNTTFSSFSAGLTGLPFAGSQVGLTSVSNSSGRLVFDDTGSIIKKRSGEFFTTEDQFFVSGSRIDSLALDQAIVLATASESIAQFYVVAYDSTGKIGLANYNQTSTTTLALALESMIAGDVKSVTLQGIVENTNWNWATIGATLWVGAAGELTDTDPHSTDPATYPYAKVPVARVLTATSIYFLQGLGAKGDQGPPGDTLATLPDATTTTKGVVKITTTNTTAVSTDDSRMSDARTPLAHTHPATDITFTPTGGITATNAQDAIVQAATIGGTTWGAIVGTLSNQTDLQAALDAKQATITVLDTAHGGTGQSTYTNGQLLIGNATGSTLTAATLTAGSGISITNGAGSITISTTLGSAITSLNLLTSASQTLATGTNGTDFNIVSATATHTFNLPIASSSNTGKLSSTDWSTFNAKQNAITGAATTITSSNLTVSRAVISNASGKIDVSATTDTELGYVSGVTSAIQTQLNGKEPTITTLSVAKGGTGQSTYLDGELLIGNSTGNTLTKATLTAGSGISITNAGGSITITSTSGGGTVTSVDASGGLTGLTFTGGPVTGSGTLTLGGTLGPGYGGTGQTSTPSDGQLLIGNTGVFSLSTLTPGVGINISSTAGTISISNAGVTSFNTRTGAVTLSSSDVSTLADSLYVKLSGSTMTGGLVMSGGNEVTGLPTLPSGATSATSKAYVDSLVTAGTVWANPVVDSNLVDVVTTTPGAPTNQTTYITYGGAYPQTWGNVSDVASGDVMEYDTSVSGNWKRLKNLTANDRFIITAERGTIGTTLYGVGFRDQGLIEYGSGDPGLFASWLEPSVSNYQVINFTTVKLSTDDTGLSGTATAGYQIVDTGGGHTGTDATGLTNDATVYTTTITIDGTAYPVSATGSANQTYTTLLATINAAISSPTNGTAAINGTGNIQVTSATGGTSSTVAIVDGATPLFASLTGFVAIDAAVPGTFGTVTYYLTVDHNGTTQTNIPISTTGIGTETFSILITDLNTAFDSVFTPGTVVAVFDTDGGHIHVEGSVSTDTIIITDGSHAVDASNANLLASLTGFDQILDSQETGTTVLVNNYYSSDYGHTYIYTYGPNKWVEISGPGYVGAGAGLSYSGTTLNVNLGNLTETVSSILTITGGTNAVVGTGTTIQISQASSTTDGYLSSTDWNTFNDTTLTLNNQTGTTYTFVLTDAGANVTFNNAAAVTATIPANSSVAFPIGTQILLTQLGTGQVTVTITTDTLNVASTFQLALAEQYSEAVITKKTSTMWVITGDLALV